MRGGRGSRAEREERPRRRSTTLTVETRRPRRRAIAGPDGRCQRNAVISSRLLHRAGSGSPAGARNGLASLPRPRRRSGRATCGPPSDRPESGPHGRRRPTAAQASHDQHSTTRGSLGHSGALVTALPTSMALRPRRSSLVTTQHVAGLQPLQGEAAALRSGNVPGHRFGDHEAGLDLEARCRDFLDAGCPSSGRWWRRGSRQRCVAWATFRSKRMVET